MTRIDKHEYFLRMAELAALRGTCARRKVGCVLVDKNNHVLATGYNGVPQGDRHCIDNPCPGAAHKSGTGLSECQAVHAEQNALLQCHDVQAIQTAYCTASPCVTCMRMLANTGVRAIFYRETYPHHEAFQLANRIGIDMVHLPEKS